MPRKIVFTGSVITGDITRDDEIALRQAFQILQSLPEKGAIDFRRNAGRTIGVGRKPTSFLTPQGMTIIRYGLDKEEFTVTDLRAGTGINKNSLAALLHGLTQTGHLSRRILPGFEPDGGGGRVAKWAYAVTDEGREAVRLAGEDAEEDVEVIGPGIGP